MVPTTGVAAPERLLRRLEWTVVRRLDGRLQGDYRTIFRGTGVDFRDLREYEPGDDLRHIDWNVTARTDVPFVREYTEDRELTAWLLLDRSASMAFGPTDRPKHTVLLELATTLALVLARGGNRVGAVLYGDGVDRTVPPRQGRDQVLRIARELLADAPTAGHPTDLGGLLRAALGMARQRSLIVIVSDFVTTPGWERPLGLLARRHDVVAIQLVDPREHDLPEAGLIALADPETGEHVLVDTGDVEFRSRLWELAQARQRQLEAVAAHAGIALHPVSTDEDLVGALLRMARLRSKWRR
jgi:uncharacterized protein (DUF58 family)